MRKTGWLVVVGLLFGVVTPVPGHTAEIEGVRIADKALVGGQSLVLNGAGVRTKFFFDIYIGALYVPKKTHDAAEVIHGAGNKRVLMHILYSEVSKDKLVKGWQAGFEKNAQDLPALQTRLKRFNALFPDLHEGDEVVFDFLARGSTTVSIKGNTVGSIEGADFQQALLAVWLGDEPADDDLKEAMLGKD